MLKSDIKIGMNLRIMKEGFNYVVGEVIQVPRTTNNVRLRVIGEPEICTWIRPCDLRPLDEPYMQPTPAPVPAPVPPVKGWYVIKRGGDTPTKLHETYLTAILEAERLAKQYTSNTFDVVALYSTVKAKREFVYTIEVK